MLIVLLMPVQLHRQCPFAMSASWFNRTISSSRALSIIFLCGFAMAEPRLHCLRGQPLPAVRHRIDAPFTADTISLKNRVDIQIRAASHRTIRGITAIAAIAEECSFWQSDESNNPDFEILHAVRPALATTGGMLFAIGSPHARRGEM
jgi:hypothetical protein